MRPDSLNRIGIAISDIFFRKALISQLCNNQNNKIDFCTSNGLYLINLTRKHKPSILIVDLYIPVISGIEAIKILRSTNHVKSILAVSTIYQEDILPLLKHEGVNGYCGHKTKDIVMAVSEISMGGTFFNAEYYRSWDVERLQLLLEPSLVSPLDALKPMELRLLQLSSEGKTNKEIASELNLSDRTIDTYINNLVHKLNLKSKLDLIKFAFDNGVCGCYCENSLIGNCKICNSPSA